MVLHHAARSLATRKLAASHPHQGPIRDQVQTFVPMALIGRLDGFIHSANRLYYQDSEPLSRKLDVLKQAVAYLQRFHDGRNELAAQSARLAAACAAFSKAYAKH